MAIIDMLGISSCIIQSDMCPPRGAFFFGDLKPYDSVATPVPLRSLQLFLQNNQLHHLAFQCRFRLLQRPCHEGCYFHPIREVYQDWIEYESSFGSKISYLETLLSIIL